MTDLVVLLGPTGAGKSTQADYLLSRHPGWVHISSGDLLRRDPVTAAKLATGALGDPAEVIRVVEAALVAHRKAPLIILDGFPRVMDQIPWLEEACQRYDLHLRAVVHIGVSQDLAAARLAARHRADDRHDAIAHKWQWYHDETIPLLKYYEQQHLVISVDGADSVETVGALIEKELNV